MKVCKASKFRLNSAMADCGWHFGLHAASPLFCYAGGAILFLLITPFAQAEPVSFHYSNFSHVDAEHLMLEGAASISSSFVHLTMNQVDQNSDWPGCFGRVTYPRLVNLWDDASNELQDFTTSFSFVVLSSESKVGDGLAFFLASPELPDAIVVPELKGGGLGLGREDPNQTLLPMKYRFVAVEFDTYSNNWDPDGAHVGVNINSMRSNILAEWWTDVSLSTMKVYNCSIEYNARSCNLNVSFTGYRSNGVPATQYLSYNIDLRGHLRERVIVGISAATGGYYEEHSLLSWSFSTSLQSIDDYKEDIRLMLEGIGIGIVFSVSLSGLIHMLLWKMNNGKEEEPTSETASDLNMDDEFRVGTGPKKISYYDLVTATNNFEESQKLGSGGFGCVYKGYLKDSYSYAAIKRISAHSRQGTKEYAAEVKIISQLRHRNLVKLTGWCHKKNDLLLVYEYIPNGSLCSHLFGEASMLTWQVRYNIALGLASALLYLQEEWEKCVLHRDIKSSNIMLDSNFNAKLGDFGLARLMDHDKGSQTTVVAGTMGYIAPEYLKTGKASKESDIYSFGIVLLEIASGRKTIHHQYTEGQFSQVSLVEWIWELYGLGNPLVAADPKLCGAFDVQQMECLLVVGLWCANPDSKPRPSVKQVMKVLHFEAPLPILPQKMPVPITCLPPTTIELFFTASSSFQATS